MRSAAENRGLTLAQVTLFEEDIVDRVERSRASGIKGIAYTDPTFPANSSALPPSVSFRVYFKHFKLIHLSAYAAYIPENFIRIAGNGRSHSRLRRQMGATVRAI